MSAAGAAVDGVLHRIHRGSAEPLTIESIVRLAGDPSASLPSTATAAALVSLLEASYSSTGNGASSASYLSSLLSIVARSPPSFSFSSLLSSLLLSFLRRCRSCGDVAAGEVASVLSLFGPHLPSIDRAHIPDILDVLCSGLGDIVDPDDALPLDLLPRLLDLSAGDASGKELVDSTIERILAAEWSKAVLLKVVSILRELPAMVSRVKLLDLLEKAFAGMRTVDLQDFPSVVYQLLLLASSRGVNKRAVIKGILGFFEGSLKGPPSIVRQVCGTILMHVNFAVKQDPSLGQELLNVVRAHPRVLNHFAFSVLFSVAKVSRFRESCIAALKLAVISAHRDYRVVRDCKWLPECLKEECLETVKCIQEALIKSVNESGCGREHVVPSIVQFGFVLLESVDGENCEQEGSSSGFMDIEELGTLMLKTLFEIHDMSRNEIIQQCNFLILSLKPQKSMPIIKLLGNLVQSFPYPMLEYVSRLKELLDYFTFLQEGTAVAVVHAILPLSRFSHSLQDYLVLVIRKAMFKRENTVRAAAAEAIIDLIVMENKSTKSSLNPLQDSSSQASCSQQADIPNGMVGGLFSELNGLLRRCLCQQARVRGILYQGLIKLVILEPPIASSILDLLWPHFLRFYQEGARTPLQLEVCFKSENGKVCSVEPLDCLISCVSWILHLQPHSKSTHQPEHSWPCFGFSLSQDNEIGKTTSGESFSNALSKIKRHLKGYRSEDAVGQCQDTDLLSLQGEKSFYHGRLLLGIIEVLVNVAASGLETAKEENNTLQKEIMELVKSYDIIEKELSMNKQRAGNRKGPLKDLSDKVNNESKDYAQVSQLRTFFATSSVQQLLISAVRSYNAYSSNRQNILSATERSNQSYSCIEDSCLQLISFTLKACLHHLQYIAATRSGLACDPLTTLLHGDIKQLGKPLMQLVWLLKSHLEQEDNPKKREVKGKRKSECKGDQISLSFLCLHEFLKLNLSGTSFAELIKDMNSFVELDPEILRHDVEGGSQDHAFMEEDQHARSVHLFLEQRLKPIYSSLLAHSLFSESVVLAELILNIGKKLPSEQRNSYGTWAVSVCQSTTVESSIAARSIIFLAMDLLPAPTDLCIAHDMALELLKVMGSEDTDPEEKSKKFPLINRSTKDEISKLFFQVAESCIIDLEWGTSKVKQLSSCNLENLGMEKRFPFGERLPGLNLEEALYSRSEALVLLLSSFTEMNLKDSQAEQLLKICARFYRLLAQMAKLRIAPKGSKQMLPSTKFQKLVEVTCRRLTSPLYDFVAFVQRNQQENTNDRGIISKIKRESKCIPDLIFQIEDYEKYLIQLSKLSKINLLRHAKRSTARDFKILETKKIAVDEMAPEPEPSKVNSASDNETSVESQGSDMLKEVSSPAANDDNAEDSEHDQEEQEMIIRKKRAKMSNVVEDSDTDS